MASYISLAVGVPVGLAALVERTLGTWRAIASTKNVGADASQAVVMLQFEAFRYMSWTQESRILIAIQDQDIDHLSVPVSATDPAVTDAVRAPPAVSIRKVLWDAITQIHIVLQDADKLLSKYGRAFESTTGQTDSQALNALSTSLATLGNQSPAAAQAVSQSQSLKENLQNQTSFVQRFTYGVQTWSDPDKDALKGLVSRFKYWNDGLHELIPLPRRNLLESRLSSEVVGPVKAREDLDRIQAAADATQYSSIARSARLKSQTSGSNRGDSGLKKSWESLQGDEKLRPNRRFVTWYSTLGRDRVSTVAPPQRVVVEWYYCNRDWTDYQIGLANERVERLASDFSVQDKPRFLRVLDCIGYICHPQKPDRALLYAFPSASPPASLTQPMSLFQILSSESGSSTQKLRPTLSERFSLASQLATAFLEIQNVGWLHKYFNSDNVLFFANPSGSICFTEPYISGFEFSRPDKPGQVSLTMRKSPLDLYRHPDLRQPISAFETLPAYHRKYDLYSLGLVLFEIGMWQRLDGFRKPNLTPEAFLARLLTYLDRDMPMLMGERYRQVVAKCISGECLSGGPPRQISFDYSVEASPGVSDVQTDNHDSSSEVASELNAFYWNVVSELQRCHCKAGGD